MTIKWDEKTVIRRVEKTTKQEAREAAKRILKDAKKYAPVGKWERDAYTEGQSWSRRKPGTLRDSIKMYRAKYREGGEQYTIFAGDYYAFYARFVELGTPGNVKRIKTNYKTKLATNIFGKSGTVPRTPIPKKPFLRRAMKKEDRRFKREMKRALGAS
jgi:HK97 gp10 family phage protein